MKIQQLAIPVVAALALSLSACGSNEDAKASKAISDGMVKESTGSTKITRKQADCVGDGMVDKVGVDKLKKYGVLSKDLKATDKSGLNAKMSKGDAEKAADVVTDCVDFKKILADTVGEQAPDPKIKTCIEDNLSDEAVKKFLVANFSGDTSGAKSALTGDLMKCMTQGAN